MAERHIDNMFQEGRFLDFGRLLKDKPSQISVGERQRTALGRALLSLPEVLLLNESFSAQDANLRNQILPFCTTFTIILKSRFWW